MKIAKNNEDIINNLFDKYSLSKEDKKEINKVLLPIVSHAEFQKRMTNEFFHHGNITLGEHIIEDTIMTYKLSKKYALNNNYQTDLALKIALFHDLYTLPWQNNKEAHVHHFLHKHGFRHPVESIINAINWYPEMFQNSRDSKLIIDGVLHHMFPFPVLSIGKKNIDYYELKNINLYNKLSNDLQNIIKDSLKRKKIGKLSFSRSEYKEGRVMNKADRIVSRHQIKDFQSMKALITGHNKKI